MSAPPRRFSRRALALAVALPLLAAGCRHAPPDVPSEAAPPPLAQQPAVAAPAAKVVPGSSHVASSPAPSSPVAPSPLAPSAASPVPAGDAARENAAAQARRAIGAVATPGAFVQSFRDQAAPLVAPAPDRERYQAFADNPVRQAAVDPVSTFSVDVDTGSYANVRRMLNAGRLPPADAVRVEEMINYFPYDYERPRGDEPFAVHVETSAAPWHGERLLMRVALKGQDLSLDRMPAANLVFLVDVSGSMNPPERLPLLKASLKLMVARMRPQDRISLVTYASGTSVVLEPTSGSEKARIVQAIDALRAGGSTAGASGIESAYRMARQGFIRDGINRILLATDGDFNVGVTDIGQLKSLVETNRKSGVSLSTLGFGTGNYNEHLMEQLADVGNGAYSYIDNLMEAQKVLSTEMASTLATIANDVKVQVEFNPARVAEYRLIGYENRGLAREDFNNDQVDAGDIGAGHTVTALYELTLKGGPTRVDPLRYGGQPAGAAVPGDAATGGAGRADEIAHVKLRYKRPGETASRLIEQPVRLDERPRLVQNSADFQFAVAIAGFGQVLRGGRYTGQWTIANAVHLARGSLGRDPYGYRAEALRLMELAAALAPPG